MIRALGLFGDAAQEGADREGRTIWQHVENRVVPHNLTVGGAFDSDRVVRRLSIRNEQTASLIFGGVEANWLFATSVQLEWVWGQIRKTGLEDLPGVGGDDLSIPLYRASA